MEELISKGNAFSRSILVVMAVITLSLVATLSAGRGMVATDEGFRQKYGLPQEPQPLIRQILSRAEFHRTDDPSLIDWLKWQVGETLLRALRWLAKRFPDGSQFHVDTSAISFVVDAMLAGLAVVIAVLVAWTLAKYFLRSRLAGPSVSGFGSDNDDASMDSGRSRSLAVSLANRGEYRGALIHLFRFVLLLLDETGQIIVRPGETNREILAAIDQNRPVYALLAQMVPLFNSIRYGDSACSREEYERFESLCAKVAEGDRAS